MECDVLIIGAGLAGLTFAERVSTHLGLTTVIVEKRNHIAGNAYDCYDKFGVLIHKYGPHYFRTNSKKIENYLSLFTEWRSVRYKILSYFDKRYWNFPINLNTFEQLRGKAATEIEMESWLKQHRIPIENPRNSEELIVSQVGWELYEKFFKNYTIKQWGRHPRDLDPSVCGRIPIRTNRNDEYLREEFQAIPKFGYTKMCENMVDACQDKLTLVLGVDYKDIIKQFRYRHLVYTGPLDSFYNHIYGRLPYRSLEFEYENFDSTQLKGRFDISGRNGFWQPAVQVNYPNDERFTRIVEIKHATGQFCSNTTIVKEYPASYEKTGEPFYPIPTPETKRLADKYKALAQNDLNSSFIGRLATYQYYNMDQVVGMALAEFERVANKLRFVR